MHRTLLPILAVSAAVPVALAASDGDLVKVVFKSLKYSTAVTISGHGDTFSAYAGTMNVTVDGAPELAYCVDIDHGITKNFQYDATLDAVGGAAPWCEIGWILSEYEPAADATTAAAIQVALWKLLYAQDGETITVTPAAVDDLADDMVAAASGTCPVECETAATLDTAIEAASDGYIYADLVVTHGTGQPAGGQEVQVSVTGGTLVSPASGEAVTGATGAVSAVIDPGSAPTTVTVEWSLDGRSLFRLVPTTEPFQQLLALQLEECTYEASTDFTVAPMGDPRTIGFWKHQFNVATGGKGHPHVDAATLQGWLPIEVFNVSVDTLKEGYDLLWIKKATMQQRAQQQCFATLLNVEFGELGWLTSLDVDLDGADDGTLAEFWGDATDAYESGDYETAKDICDGINNL